MKLDLKKAGRKVDRVWLEVTSDLLSLSKDVRLQGLGLLLKYSGEADVVERIVEGKKEFKKKFPRDPVKLEQATKDFVANLENNPDIDDIVKDDFLAVFGFSLQADKPEIDGEYKEFANSEIYKVSSEARKLRDNKELYQKLQDKIDSNQGSVVELKKQQEALNGIIQAQQQEIYQLLVSNLGDKYSDVLASLKDISDDPDEVIKAFKKIVKGEKVQGATKTTEQKIRDFEAWSNAFVDVASLFMDPKDAGTIGAILDVGIAVAMVSSGDAGSRVQNAAHLVRAVTKLVGITLIKKGKGWQEQMQEAIIEIQKSIDKLREEMHKRFMEVHERFDRLETFLKGINRRLDTAIAQNFSIEQEVLKLQLATKNLGKFLALVDRKIDIYDLAEWRRDTYKASELFTNAYEEGTGDFGSSTKPQMSYVDTFGRTIDCLGVFLDHATSTARRNLYTAQDMVTSGNDLFVLYQALDRRGAEHCHAILKAAVGTGGSLNIPASEFPFSVSNLVTSNPLEFARGAQAVVEVPDLFWKPNGLSVPKDKYVATLTRLKAEARRIQGVSRVFVMPVVLEAAADLYQSEYNNFWKVVEKYLNDRRSVYGQADIMLPREVVLADGEKELDPIKSWISDKRVSVSDGFDRTAGLELKAELQGIKGSYPASLIAKYTVPGSTHYNPFYPTHHREPTHEIIILQEKKKTWLVH